MHSQYPVNTHIILFPLPFCYSITPPKNANPKGNPSTFHFLSPTSPLFNHQSSPSPYSPPPNSSSLSLSLFPMMLSLPSSLSLSQFYCNVPPP